MKYRVIDVEMPERSRRDDEQTDGPAAWRDLHALILAIEAFSGRPIVELPRSEWPVTMKRVRIK